MDPKELLANEETRGQLLSALTENGFVVRSKEEEETYKTNLLNQGVEDKIGSRIREMHSQYEKDVFDVTGIKKDNPDEKAYEYNKRVLATLKGKTAEYEQQLTQLQEQIKAGDNSGQLKDLEKQFQQRLQEKENELNQFKSQSELLQKAQLLEQSISPLTSNFKKDLTSLERKAIEREKQDFLQTAKLVEVDGKSVLVAADKEGNPLKDRNLSYITADAYFDEILKEAMQPEQRKQGGAGTTGGKPVKFGGTEINLKGVPKNRVELNFMLKEAGGVFGTKDYDEAYKEKVKEFNL